MVRWEKRKTLFQTKCPKLSMQSYRTSFSEFKILGETEAETLIRQQPYKWNVVSISIPQPDHKPDWYREPNMKYADTFCSVRFHDATVEKMGITLCCADDINKILNYTRQIKNDEPLLIHCAAGISRSAAIGVLVMLDKIKDLSETPGEDAAGIVKMIRKICMPNHQILNLGIPLIARNTNEQIKWFREIYNSNLWK